MTSGFASIVFPKCLESTDVSLAKQPLALSTVVTDVLGILLLDERITLRKLTGIALGITAVYLLTIE